MKKIIKLTESDLNKIIKKIMIESDNEDEITKTEYDIINKISNINEGYNQLIENYNNFIKDDKEEDIDNETVMETFDLACNMLKTSLINEARLLEISLEITI